MGQDEYQHLILNEFIMDEIDLQAIFNEVQQYMSNDWKQIAVYCAVLDNMQRNKILC